MKVDFYLKFVLTVIAVCFVGYLFKSGSVNTKAHAGLTSSQLEEVEATLNTALRKQAELTRDANKAVDNLRSRKLISGFANVYLLHVISRQNDILIELNALNIKVLNALLEKE